MTILITGGGTGGHLAIARALKEAALRHGCAVVYVGSRSGQDRAWFEHDEGFRSCYFLSTTGVVNKRGLSKLGALWAALKAFFEVMGIMRREKVDAVISVGGYSAAPASFGAKVLGVPLYIHEQNAVAGRLNTLLRPYAKAYFCSYDERSPLRDYPVAKRFFETARVRQQIETVIFLGGSQGARFINDLALELTPILHSRGIHIIHQCGENDYERVAKEYAKLGIEAELYGFSDALHVLMARADLAIARAGASTLWELCANGLCAFFIPYPHAAGDHQYYNAEFLRTKGLGWMQRQEDIHTASLVGLLDESLEERSRALMEMVSPDGAQQIVAYIAKSTKRG